MEPWNVLENLKDLADKLNVEIIYENMGWDELPITGGLCKVKGKYKVFVDQSQSIEKQIEILAKAFAFFNTEDVYMLPVVRQILEKAMDIKD
ncbi:MAG: hypothetical protein U9R17_00930 [Thermodesulfobacteriota bacterium]|nr:hypothetical protein [Thermodesulfobacteriota bacterium]